MLCPPLEESGNPVVCYPVAGYPLGVKASWEPVQEGSGTPYPAGGGKNQLNPAEYEAATKTVKGITFTRSNTGEVVVNGTATGTAIYGLIKNFSYPISLSTDRNWSIAGENVISAQGLVSGVTVTRPSDNTALYVRVASGTTVKTTVQPQIEKGNTPTAWAPYENIRPIKGRDSVRVERCGANLSKISDISTPNKTLTPVELPTEIVADIEISFDTLNAEIKNVGTAFFLNKADGKWKAITVQNFGISTAGKIPNGRKTAVFHGVAFKTVETVIIENGYCGWSGNVNNFCVSLIQNAPYTPYIGQTNTLTLPETVYGGEVDAVSGEGQETWQVKSLDGTEGWAIRDTYIGVYNLLSPTDSGKAICTHFDVRRNYSGDCLVISDVGTVYLAHALSDKYTVDTWCAYLAAQHEAGTPVQICYKLAEPVPFTATGAQPMPALAGVNTVLTDADSATVTGRADPIKRITDLEDAVASQT